MWTQDLRGRRSIWRGLSAIEFLLLLRLPILCMAHVRWYSDHRVTAKIIEVGSMRFEWHTPTLKVFIICYEHSIHLDIEWILRDCNTRANVISKLIDFDDRQVTEDVFKDLGNLWGPPTVDCFATYYNRKIVRYFSRFWNTDTSGIDAFMQSWNIENSQLVLLVCLIPKLLRLYIIREPRAPLLFLYGSRPCFGPC